MYGVQMMISLKEEIDKCIVDGDKFRYGICGCGRESEAWPGDTQYMCTECLEWVVECECND